MAIVNILAKSSKAINWENLANDLLVLNLNSVEVFPIPKELGFEQSSIGINVHQGYESRIIVISEIKTLIDFLSIYNFEFIELYDGTNVNESNVSDLIDKLLPR